MIDRPDWAEAIWPRMAPFFDAIDGGEPVGVNERFRFYRYGAGQYFEPHYDGYFRRSVTERSLWTVLIYLIRQIVGIVVLDYRKIIRLDYSLRKFCFRNNIATFKKMAFSHKIFKRIYVLNFCLKITKF